MHALKGGVQSFAFATQTVSDEIIDAEALVKRSTARPLQFG